MMDDMEFTLHVSELQTYIQAVYNLNRPGLCQFGTTDITELRQMIKTFLIRIKDLKGANFLKMYANMLCTFGTVPQFKGLNDDRYVFTLY